MGKDTRPDCDNTDCDGNFGGKCDTKDDSDAYDCEGNSNDGPTSTNDDNDTTDNGWGD
jgi:hypothetical protein